MSVYDVTCTVDIDEGETDSNKYSFSFTPASSSIIFGFDYNVTSSVTIISVSPTETTTHFIGYTENVKMTREGKISGICYCTSWFTSLDKRSITLGINFTPVKSSTIPACNYKINGEAVNKLVRPYENCTMIACLNSTYFKQTDDCGSHYGKEYNASYDKWNESVDLSTYTPNGVQRNFVKAGTNPQFKNGSISLGPISSCFAAFEGTVGTTLTVTIKYTSTSLVITSTAGTTTYTADQFPDKVIPTKVMVAILAGGGSGAGGNWNTGSGGGGGGGFWCGIVDLTKHTIVNETETGLDYGIYITVGGGGAKVAGDSAANAGEASVISGIKKLSTGFSPYNIVKVDGGTGGGYGSYDNASGGAMSAFAVDGYWTLYSSAGKYGGSRAGGENSKNGGSFDGGYVYATEITADRNGKNIQALAGQAGGTGGSAWTVTNWNGGGGGASAIGTGGNGGGQTSIPGKSGIYGGGGGGAGASGLFGGDSESGDGGNGCCWIWF